MLIRNPFESRAMYWVLLHTSFSASHWWFIYLLITSSDLGTYAYHTEEVEKLQSGVWVSDITWFHGGTWVWARSGSWWWAGKPGVLQSMGLWRVRHDWATKLNWYTLGKEMATLSSILAWRIPWTEEPGGLQSMGSQRVGHDWVTNTCLSLDVMCKKIVA